MDHSRVNDYPAADLDLSRREGWGDFPELRAFMKEFGAISARVEDGIAFIAEIDGRAIAAAMLGVHDRVALLAGASTVPSQRRKGAQTALLEARLSWAAAHGCELAMLCAQPGSGSQNNAERNEFRVAYTRLKWRLSGQ